jgi:tetratricopeptide (TPR) repeat protein
MQSIGIALVAGLLAMALLVAGGCSSTPSAPQSATEIYLEAGRYKDAAREAEQAVRVQPNDVELRKLAGRAHAGAGNPDRALEHLEVAFDLAPSDPEVSVLIGELEQKRSNLSDAYVAFRRATQLDPKEIRAWSGLALSAEALGFEEEAADAYAQWARLEQELGLAP